MRSFARSVSSAGRSAPTSQSSVDVRVVEARLRLGLELGEKLRDVDPLDRETTLAGLETAHVERRRDEVEELARAPLHPAEHARPAPAASDRTPPRGAGRCSP